MDMNDFEKLRGKLEDAKVSLNRAEGVRSQLYAKLKEEFNCDTLEQAKLKLDQLENKIKEQETEMQKKCEQLDSIVEWDKL